MDWQLSLDRIRIFEYGAERPRRKRRPVEGPTRALALAIEWGTGHGPWAMVTLHTDQTRRTVPVAQAYRLAEGLQ
jgi:hypothetical protein